MLTPSDNLHFQENLPLMLFPTYSLQVCLRLLDVFVVMLKIVSMTAYFGNHIAQSHFSMCKPLLPNSLNQILAEAKTFLQLSQILCNSSGQAYC